MTYISRDAAIGKITALINKSGKYTAYESGADDACYIVEHEIPAADVVEVVRCKDCKLMSHDEHGYWCINDYQASLDPEKDYCSRAVRRSDNG